MPGKRLVISRKLSELGCDVARVLSTRSETPADISSGTSFERSLSSYVIVAVGVRPRGGNRLSRVPSRVRLRLIRIHSSHDSAALAASAQQQAAKAEDDNEKPTWVSRRLSRSRSRIGCRHATARYAKVSVSHASLFTGVPLGGAPQVRSWHPVALGRSQVAMRGSHAWRR